MAKVRTRGHISSRKRKDGSLSYVFKATVTVDGVRKPIMRGGFASPEEAQQAMTKALAESDQGEFREPSKMLYSQWFREWIGSVTDIEPGTRRSYEYTFRKMLDPHIGRMKLADIRGTHVGKLWRDLLDHGGLRGKPLSNNTVLKGYVVLSGSLEAARKQGLIPRNPVADVKPPKSKPKARPVTEDDDGDDDDGLDQTWTEAEVDAFLDWCGMNPHIPHHFAVMWRLYALTGCRRGELLALRWRHVSSKDIFIRQSANQGDGRDVVFGPTKNLSKRHVSHYRNAAAVLDAWKQYRGRWGFQLIKPNSLVFADPNGKPFVPIAISQRFAADMKRYRESLGADAPMRLVLHGLRHAHGSHLLVMGVPDTIVAERLGHSIATLQHIYRHVLRGSQELHLARISQDTDRYTQTG